MLVAIIMVASACGTLGEQGAKDLPSSPVEADDLVVRVSGTEGVAYKGSYGTSFLKRDETDVKKTTVKSEPTEYKVNLQKGKDKAVFAEFSKTQSNTEQLEVEIVADDEVAVEGSTNVEKGSVFIDWGLENVPLPKLPKFKAPPPPKIPSPPKFEPPPKPKMPKPPKFQ